MKFCEPGHLGVSLLGSPDPRLEAAFVFLGPAWPLVAEPRQCCTPAVVCQPSKVRFVARAMGRSSAVMPDRAPGGNYLGGTTARVRCGAATRGINTGRGVSPRRARAAFRDLRRRPLFCLSFALQIGRDPSPRPIRVQESRADGKEPPAHPLMALTTREPVAREAPSLELDYRRGVRA